MVNSSRASGELDPRLDPSFSKSIRSAREHEVMDLAFGRCERRERSGRHK
jgi:hypothetical protein